MKALNPASQLKRGQSRMVEGRRGHAEEAFLAFAWAGVITRYDVEAFVRATYIGVITGIDPTNVIQVAYRIHGAHFIRSAAEAMDAPPEVRDTVMAAIEQALRTLPDTRDDSVTLRFVAEDGTYEEIVLDV